MADPILDLRFGRLIFRVGRQASPRVFLVHGHDLEVRNEVRRFLLDLGVEPIILDEEASEGLTIIEKFERHSKGVSLALGLLTPDDIGHPLNKPEEVRNRARQNVIFELGFFVGRLGRRRVIALHGENVDIPSDYHGVINIPLDDHGEWALRLVREFENASLPLRKIDLALRNLPTP